MIRNLSLRIVPATAKVQALAITSAQRNPMVSELMPTARPCQS